MYNKSGGVDMIKRIKNKFYINNILLKEKNHHFSDRELKYIFLEEKNSNELVIVFSGFPASGKAAAYNYISTLKKTKMNKLFILDDFGVDKRGAYYLGENGDYSIEKATSSLINYIIKKYNIKKISSAGSSKGGFAALYFGFKHKFNDIIVAEPQVLLGNYLNTPNHEYILKFITGNLQEDSIHKLNNLLIELIIVSNTKPNVYINYGQGSNYYPDHIIYLERILHKREINLFLKADDYNNHNDLVNFYPEFLVQTLNKK